jgi:hypothetical protein
MFSVGAGVGAGAGGGGGLFADSSAFALKSLSLPASMIPDKVPVKNVAIGIINSKNLLSTGLIPFMGCVTKMIEKRTTKTIPVNVIARHTPMKNFNLAFSSSSVYFGPDHKSLIICNSPNMNFVSDYLYSVFHSVLNLLGRFRLRYSKVSDTFFYPNYQGLDKDSDIFLDKQLKMASVKSTDTSSMLSHDM